MLDSVRGLKGTKLTLLYWQLLLCFSGEDTLKLFREICGSLSPRFKANLGIWEDCLHHHTTTPAGGTYKIHNHILLP